MLRNRLLDNSDFLTSEFAQSTNSDSFSLENAEGFSVVAQVTVSMPSAKNFSAGEAEVTTLTFADKAGTSAGDYVVIYDTEGLAWAVAADKSGSDPEPTGAIWDSIDASRKALADISACTNAASVAAAFELAFDGLTDVPFATDDSANNGTMVVTMILRGTTEDAVVKNEDDSGAGSISEAQTNQGVASSVDTVANTITIANHGLKTGLKGQLTSTGTLPGGLAASTDYFVIVVDANTIKLASSLNNANAGTAIDITDQGTEGVTHTFTATALAGASVKLQGSNDDSVWIDLGISNNITTTASFLMEKVDPMFKYGRIVYTMTAGQISVVNQVVVKG